MQNQLQHIVQLLQSKQYSQAIAYCRQLLTQTNHPQIHLLLAIALGESQNLAEGIKIFDHLLLHFPRNPDIYYNYALILQNNKQLDKASNLYQTCLSLQPQNYSAWNNLGEIYRHEDNFELAIDAFMHCLQLQPNNLQYLHNLGIAYYQNEQFDKAQPLLLKVFESTKFETDDCVALLDILISLRQLRLATDIGSKALAQFPENPEILNLVGLNELEKRKFTPAIHYFKQALVIQPHFLSALSHLASAYAFAGMSGKSLDTLKAIESLGSEEAFVFASMTYETGNHNPLATNTVAKGLHKFPNNPELLIIQARLLNKDKNFHKSLTSIDNALEHIKLPSIKSTALYEKGKILDKLNEYDRAWKQYKTANQLALTHWKRLNTLSDPFIQTCEKMVDSFQQAKPILSPLYGNNLGSNLVFIVGFPRSGTTLLDSILSAHSEVTVLEEAPVIGETYDQIAQMTPSNYAQVLTHLDEAQLNDLRQFYFDALGNYSNWNQQGVLVDKSPLNTMHIGFITTLFPQAKIIFSLRHPMDVCLSCYFQDFKMNGFMTNMTDIVGTAKTYDAMLKVWKITIEKTHANVHYQSYEKLVSNFEEQIKSLFNYLNLDWQSQVLNFQDSLKNRGVISTPSYDQVNQPIYQSAKNRYKNYLPHLQQALEILAPWIDYFGYKK